LIASLRRELGQATKDFEESLLVEVEDEKEIEELERDHIKHIQDLVESNRVELERVKLE